MKIGELDIKKAYFGAKELTPTNAYLGDIPIKKNEGIPNDEIWYTSTDGKIVTPHSTKELPTILSNIYNNGKGIIKFANDITRIGDYAFTECSNLTSVTIPNSVTNIGAYAFSDSGLTSIIFSENITNIGTYSFKYCPNLTSIIIPESVKSIYSYAFYYCTGLTSITIGSGITNIPKDSFSYCTNLTSISYTGTISQWNAITKDESWNTNVPATVVHCSDGDAPI